MFSSSTFVAKVVFFVVVLVNKKRKKEQRKMRTDANKGSDDYEFKPWRFSSSSIASSSSVRFASIFPISFNTSAGSLPPVWWLIPWPDMLLPVLPLAYSCARAALCFIVPAFSFANGSESDSVLELDWKNTVNINIQLTISVKLEKCLCSI